MAAARLHYPPLTASERLFYGLGAVAFGVKDCGFSYWLLIFYNQCLGLSSERAAAALFIALVFDAVADVCIGSFSDGLRTRWGRRHPLMYSSAVPAALLHAALWNPPSFVGSDDALFAYLALMAVLVRSAVSLNEIPQLALVAELTSSYDGRTSILSLRFFFGWAAGISITVLLQSALLHPSAPGARDAFFDRVGFGQFGLVGSVLMLLATVISAAGIHHRIPQLRSLEPRQRPRAGSAGEQMCRKLRELAATLSNRALLSVLGSSLLFAMSSGLSTNLWNYMAIFFWELEPHQTATLAGLLGFSAAFAAVAAPIISRRLGKRTAALCTGACAAVIGPTPVLLRLLGLMPPNRTPALFATLAAFSSLDTAMWIQTSILASSMLADVVDDAEAKTGRRSEGVLFGLQTFARKAVNGLGLLAAGAVLSVAAFPAKSLPGDVDRATVMRLGMMNAACTSTFVVCGLAVLATYPIDRATHEINLSKARCHQVISLNEAARPFESDEEHLVYWERRG